MEKRLFYLVSTIMIAVLILIAIFVKDDPENMKNSNDSMKTRDRIELPEPEHVGSSFEEVLAKRRSERDYEDGDITLEELSQILWSAQGITDPERGFRATPSAGATYPLEVLIDIQGVRGLEPGIYEYEPERHSLALKTAGSERELIYQAALRQEPVKSAPVLIVITGVYDRITPRYGERGVMYTHIEAGHASQNIYLQATSLGLGTVAIGAFENDRLKEILKTEAEPLYLMPIGRADR